MKSENLTVAIVALTLSVSATAADIVLQSAPTNWRFHREGDEIGVPVSVPHDWAIYGPVLKNNDGIYDDMGRCGGYNWRGKFRYEADFVRSGTNTAIYLEFGGVMARPRVYVNGQLAGEWDYGYMSFALDVSQLANVGTNRLTVCGLAAHAGAYLISCPGAITDKTPGWTFEASKAKGGVYFNEFEGYYPDKGGKLISKRVKVEGNRYYRLTFDAKAKERGYEAVNFYNGEGNWIADNYDVVYAGERQHYDRVVFAMPGTDSLEVFFQSKSGLEAWDVKIEKATVDDAAAYCDRTYAKLPPLDFKPEGNPLQFAPRTLEALKAGKPWRILMLGDSIVQDTYHSQFHALVQRLYPKANVTWLVSVRGSTGCWYYQDEKNFAEYVTRHNPNCVMIGGISGWIHPEMALNGGPAIEVVAERIINRLKAEVIVMTPTLSYDLRDADIQAAWDRSYKVNFGATELTELKAICARHNWPFWDLYTPAYAWLKSCERPIGFYSRDQVHSGEFGKQIIARLMERCFRNSRGRCDALQ